MSNSKFCAVLHYDSSISDHLMVRLPSRMELKCAVTNLQFKLPDDKQYDDLTAYLWISGNLETCTLSVNQKGKRKDGFVIPIVDPGQRCEIRTAFVGKMLNEGELKFTILDKSLNEVEISRLVCTMTVTNVQSDSQEGK